MKKCKDIWFRLSGVHTYMLQNATVARWGPCRRCVISHLFERIQLEPKRQLARRWLDYRDDCATYSIRTYIATRGLSALFLWADFWIVEARSVRVRQCLIIELSLVVAHQDNKLGEAKAIKHTSLLILEHAGIDLV